MLIYPPPHLPLQNSRPPTPLHVEGRHVATGQNPAYRFERGTILSNVKRRLLYHQWINDLLRCCDYAAAAAAVVVDQVIDQVGDSISMAPRIRARNSVAVNSPDKSIVVVHMNGLDGIDGIDV